MTAFGGWDLLLCPAAAGPAWPHDHAGERWMRKISVMTQGEAIGKRLVQVGA
jgi:hypothetical protein